MAARAPLPLLLAAALAHAHAAPRPEECRTCQLAMANLDEALVPALFDLLSKRTPPPYGAVDALVEAKVEDACATSAVHLVAHRRRQCADLLDSHFDAIAAAFRAIADAHAEGNGADEADAVAAVCGTAARVCPPPYDSMEVSDVVRLEEELTAGGSGDGEQSRYASEPKPGKRDQRAFGTARKLVASTFLDEVVVADTRDAVVYFATPTATPLLHATTLEHVHWIAARLKDAGASSKKACLVGVLDVEKNTVPPPYGTHLGNGAAVHVYPARRKRTPTVVFHRDASLGDVSDAEFAPRRADLLVMLGRRAALLETQKAANESVVALTDAVGRGEERDL